MRLLLAVTGRFFAAAPESVPAAVCAAFGDLIWFCARGRRRKVLASLHRAFPDKTEAWRRGVGRTSCRRTVEMALLVISSPYFSPERVKKTLIPDGENSGWELFLETGGTVLFSPHLTMMEAMPMGDAIFPGFSEKVTGAFFRPLDNPAMNAFVKESRAHYGLRLYSRKQGFGEAIRLLREGGRMAVLFDQNAGSPGSLSLFFGRVASTSELAGLMVEKTGALPVICLPVRTAFWRGTLRVERLFGETSAQLAAAANRRLERELSRDAEVCSQWLWLHNRWKTQNGAERRLRLEAKRTIIAEDLVSLGLVKYPETGDSFFIRMPNWLGDAVMALPLVRAIRAGRPDVRITLLARRAFVPLLESLGVANRVVPLADKGLGYYGPFRRALRLEYPDTHLLFTNSLRGDLEARLCGAPQRFGVARPERPRRLLSHAWPLPADLVESETHQTRLWERWLREAHGLEVPADISPLRPAALTAVVRVKNRIGLVCGTENFPAKRWPVARWRELIALVLKKNPGAEIRLFGAANDRAITAEVAGGFSESSVRDLAGKTGLLEYCAELAACSALVCNDTGGMHLANMIGTPLVAIFGPTNPVRTGPVFAAPAMILLPPDSPATGGADIAGVSAEAACEALAALSPG